MKTKTIGPMELNFGDWILPLPSWACLCDDVVREHFNIPDTATKLWVTLTKQRPKHPDAIRVRWDMAGTARLDNDKRANHYICWPMRREAIGFGNDFYATIHYT